MELLWEDSATKPHEDGVLVVDETGDCKDGKQTAHVAHQYLSSVGRIANGIVSVSSVWADESVYYPLHIEPYEPGQRLPRGKTDPAFRTKPQIGVDLVDRDEKRPSRFAPLWLIPFTGRVPTSKGNCGRRKYPTF